MENLLLKVQKRVVNKPLLILGVFFLALGICVLFYAGSRFLNNDYGQLVDGVFAGISMGVITIGLVSICIACKV